MNRALCQHHGGEVLRCDDRKPDIGHSTHFPGKARLGHRGDRAHPRRRDLPCDRLEPAGLEHEALNDPRQQQEHPGTRILRLGDDRLGRKVADHGNLTPAGELRVIEPVEQVDPAQIVQRRTLGLGHALARYSWMSDTAIEPSPTALATRLIERVLTSPATNTPGTLVSSTYGSRGNGHP